MNETEIAFSNKQILIILGDLRFCDLFFLNRGICAKDRIIARQIDVLVQPMSKAYLELYESALKIREFFGLRDFYRYPTFTS